MVTVPSSGTLSVGAATFNGQVINPLSADLTVERPGRRRTAARSPRAAAASCSSTPRHAQRHADVTAGGLQTGVANGGSSLTDVVLQSSDWINLNDYATLYGSLARQRRSDQYGGAIATLTVGADGNSTTFSGRSSLQRHPGQLHQSDQDRLRQHDPDRGW